MSTATMRKPRKGHAYAVRTSSTNVLDVYRQATVADLEEGMSWYADAKSVAHAMDPENPSRAAGVIAALSPRLAWGRNVMLAARAYEEGYASGALSANTRKADQILGGAMPSDVLSGRKVRAFYGSIMGEADAVCIDRHAFDVAMGRVTNDESRAALSRVGVYDRVARCYVKAAEILSAETGVQVTPAQVQAVTWCVWRRLKGIAD